MAGMACRGVDYQLIDIPIGRGVTLDLGLDKSVCH
jgi:hypothetical protein